MDSGAYTEITTYGAWRYDPDHFGAVVTRILDNVGTLHAMGLRLHGFGLHSRALARCHNRVSSVDTMGWSRTARWAMTAMSGCDHRGSCANCPHYAQRWYDSTLRAVA